MYEPWIPADGKDYSLMGLLENAHRISGISCASPLETYAVYRLVIAFVMDALRMPNKDVRHRLIGQPPFDMEAIKAYVRLCEQEGASFDLFDEKRPFMQIPYVVDKKEKSIKSVAQIEITLPSGQNHVFFDHRMESEHALTPQEALRALLTKYTFCQSGGRGYRPSINGEPCVYALVKQDTLYQMLLLNAISIAECGNLSYGVPAWREDRASIFMTNGRLELPKVNMLEALTWQPIGVKLIPKGGLVNNCVYKPGMSCKNSGLWKDPHVAYVWTKDLLLPIKPKLYRAFWRDIGAYTLSKDDKYCCSPLVIRNLPREVETIVIEAVGIVTEKAKVMEVAHETMSIPYDVLHSDEFGDIMAPDMDFVEHTEKLIRSTMRQIRINRPKITTDKLSSVSSVVSQSFLYDMHDYIFVRYFPLLEHCNTDEAYRELRTDIENEARKSLNKSFALHLVRIGDSAEWLRLCAEIKNRMMSDFAKLIERRKKEDGRIQNTRKNKKTAIG